MSIGRRIAARNRKRTTSHPSTPAPLSRPGLPLRSARTPASARALPSTFALAVALLIATSGPLALLGCATGDGADRASAPRLSSRVPRKTSDGLELVRTTKRSVLWVKPDHHLGRYDDVLVQLAGFLYADGQAPLDAEQEKEVGRLLVESLARITDAGPVGMTRTPGPCTVVVNVGLKDLRLHTAGDHPGGSSSSYVTSFGSATLVVEFRDSLTGTPLVRYMAARGLGGGPATGRAGANLPRLGRTLGEIVTGMVDDLARIVPSTTGRVEHQCNDGIYALTGRG
jgi:hypothetical protein